MWQASTDTPPPTRKLLSAVCDSGPNSFASSAYHQPSVPPPLGFGRCGQLTYLSSGLVVSLCRRDLISALVGAGCAHLATKIFSYLDSASLLSSSLVCVSWQRLLLSSVYTTPKFRRRVRAAIFGAAAARKPLATRLTLTLDASKATVVDVAVDDDFNIFVLGLVAGKAEGV